MCIVVVALRICVVEIFFSIFEIFQHRPNKCFQYIIFELSNFEKRRKKI